VNVASSHKNLANGIVKLIVCVEIVVAKILELFNEVDLNGIASGTIDVDVTINVDVCKDVESVEGPGALVLAETDGTDAINGVLEGGGRALKDARCNGSCDVHGL